MMLPAGIPLMKDYKNLQQTKYYNALSKESSSFSKTYSKFINYKKDYFKLWSRRWEYTFVYQKLVEFKEKNPSKKLKVLDAGSGVKFFPYFIKENLGSDIICSDLDPSFKEVFKNVNQGKKIEIPFIAEDLHKLTHEDDSFDVIYCLSVLEHTDNYNEIIKEFKRILKPNGLLIITFDIVLSGEGTIQLSEANNLVNGLKKFFSEEVNLKDINQLIKDDILTTKKAEKKSLPWDFTFRRVIMNIRNFDYPFKRPFRHLTIYCNTYKNA